MAATGFTPIKIYASSTASNVPLAANLDNTNGAELAINTADGRLFYKDSAGNVQTMASKATGAIGGSTTQVQFNNAGVLGGSASLTWSGTVLTSSGFSGPLNGTVGATTPAAGSFTTVGASGAVTLSGGTANGVTYLNGSKVLTSGSALTFDGTKFTQTASTTAAGGLAEFKNTATGSQTGNILATNDAGTAVSMRVFGSAAGTYGMLTAGSPMLYTTASELNLVADNASGVIKFGLNSAAEQMRLTSTGLGIGTSSPAAKLQVANSFAGTNDLQTISRFDRASSGTAANGLGGRLEFSAQDNAGSQRTAAWLNWKLADVSSGGPKGYLSLGSRGTAEALIIDDSGNLGLGITPSAWASTSRAIQIGANSFLENNGSVATYIGFNGYRSATGFKYLTNSYAQIFGAENDGAFRWYQAASGTAGNAITFTQAMTLDASGNLGVGTTSPSQRLHVNSAGAAIALIQSTLAAGNTNVETRYTSTNRTWGVGQNIIQTSSIFEIADVTASATRLAIDSSGNVGIGTSSPTYKLSISTSAGGNAFYITDNTSADFTIIPGVSTGVTRVGCPTGAMALYAAGAEAARINTSGNLLVGTTSSSGTIATNVQPVVAGIFRSATATVNVNNNTAGTLFTLPDRTSNISTYIVSATINTPSASAANYSAYAIICVQNNTAKIMTQVNGANMTITLSGLNVQVTQTSGGNQDCIGTVTRVA